MQFQRSLWHDKYSYWLRQMSHVGTRSLPNCSNYNAVPCWQSEKSSKEQHKCWGSCHPCGRSRRNHWLLAPDYLSQDHCRQVSINHQCKIVLSPSHSVALSSFFKNLFLTKYILYSHQTPTTHCPLLSWPDCSEMTKAVKQKLPVMRTHKVLLKSTFPPKFTKSHPLQVSQTHFIRNLPFPGVSILCAYSILSSIQTHSALG